MRKLLAYLRAYRKESVLAPLFKLLEVSFELLVPLVVASIIDRGIGSGDHGYIVRMALLMAALGLVGLASAVAAQYFAAKAAVGFASKIRHALFAHIQRFSYAQIDAQGVSTMITRMTSDVNQVQNGVNLTLRLFLRSPFVVFGAVIMAFSIDAQSAMVFALDVPILFTAVFGVLLVSLPLYQKVQKRLERVLGATRENLTGARVLRAFRKEESEIQTFETENGALYALQRFVGRISALLNPLTYVLVNAGVIALVYVGALRVSSGALSGGQVVALYNYMSQILVELIKLANLIITMTKAAASGRRIQSLLDVPAQDAQSEKPEVAALADAPRVTFEHVSFSYEGAGGSALHDISFSAMPGQTIGIIGGTGSGKTTLAQLIPRLYEATDGVVKVDGVDVRDYPAGQLLRKVGMAPQKSVLFSGTIRENLAWGDATADDAAMNRALEIAQAADVLRSKPNGLDAEVLQGGKNFSGGQRQRLCIARALIADPEIVILDDSSSALDYATDARLRQALRALPGKPTVLIISQRTASIRQADQILVLDDGRMVGQGTHQELMKTCDIYREIHESQYGSEAHAI